MNIPTTPLDYYHEQCAKGVIFYDEQQFYVMKYFQQLHHELHQEYQKRSTILAFLRQPKYVHGLYIWGGVGIGKTFMMDCFYHTLPIDKKIRMHFHQFMQMIHRELKHYQGEMNPLKIIAKKISKKAMVLCFDEFIVSDIVDAMLLGRLFSALFSCGVCIVSTSNVMPDDLYKDGLQRKLFLPTIALLKKNSVVFHLKSDIDYRLRHVKIASVFYFSRETAVIAKMEKCFSLLSQHASISVKPIEIGGHLVKIKKEARDVIWFDFKALCYSPRNQHDYLEIAKKYRTIFISDIPIILAHQKDIICLFIRLIDVLYDAHIRIVCSAAIDIEKIYIDGPMIFEYKRTCSRLIEMQSENYFYR